MLYDTFSYRTAEFLVWLSFMANITFIGAIPSPRNGPGLASTTDGVLYLFGGNSRELKNSYLLGPLYH